MSNPYPDVFVVRHRLWSLWLRLALCFQAPLLLITGVFVVCRMATGARLADSFDAPLLRNLSIGVACLSAITSVVYWWHKRWFLTVYGVHQRGSFAMPTAFPTVFWNRVAVVQRRRDWFGVRWLRIVPEYGEVINLPGRPADLPGFRKAVERFAGPNNPLTLALAEISDEG